MHSRGRSRTLTISSIALLSVAAGCGPAGEPTDTGDSQDLTNVDPRETLIQEEPPRLDASAGETAEGDAAMDPRDAAQQDLGQVDAELHAGADIAPASGSTVSGALDFQQQGETVRITGTLNGLEPGKHGLHVHVAGDCSAPDAASAEGHFAPDGDPHGSPQGPDDQHHVGDLGNIVADEDGIAEIDKTDTEISLETGDMTILGRAVIVHAEPDDMTSQPSGAAGDRVGCGIVEIDPGPAYTGA